MHSSRPRVSEGVCQPTMLLSQQGTESSMPPASSVGANSTSVEGSHLVPSPFEDVEGPFQAECPI